MNCEHRIYRVVDGCKYCSFCDTNLGIAKAKKPEARLETHAEAAERFCREELEGEK